MAGNPLTQCNWKREVKSPSETVEVIIKNPGEKKLQTGVNKRHKTENCSSITKTVHAHDTQRRYLEHMFLVNIGVYTLFRNWGFLISNIFWLSAHQNLATCRIGCSQAWCSVKHGDHTACICCVYIMPCQGEPLKAYLDKRLNLAKTSWQSKLLPWKAFNEALSAL